MSDKIFKEENIITQCDVENKQLKEENGKLKKENEKLRKKTENETGEMANEKREMTNENEQFLKNNIVKDANIKELIEEPKDIKSSNWIDKNQFEKMLAIIDSNKFNQKNKIGEFKYINIRDILILEIIQLVKYLPKQI